MEHADAAVKIVKVANDVVDGKKNVLQKASKNIKNLTFANMEGDDRISHLLANVL